MVKKNTKTGQNNENFHKSLRQNDVVFKKDAFKRSPLSFYVFNLIL